MKLFFDIDTQIDFVFPAGALYSAGAESVIGPVARLNRFAAENGIPLISSMCAHPEDAEEFREWPPHCVIGTFGQQKPAATLLEKRAVIPNEAAELGIEDAQQDRAQQILVEKNDLDVFSNPNVNALLDEMGADEFYVYGVFTEYCVDKAAMGLLKRGGRVWLVSDAMRAVEEPKGRQTIEAFTAAGGAMTTVRELTGASL
jgi:nicotinamidase/pyrazinamidase